jgi:Cu(I)/Ag(I) efflux system membrane protein CusA/SilA
MVGAVERVRPKMMTVVAIMAGLVPILWSTGCRLGGHAADRRADDRRHGVLHRADLVVIPAVYGLVKGWRLSSSAAAAEATHEPVPADLRTAAE